MHNKVWGLWVPKSKPHGRMHAWETTGQNQENHLVPKQKFVFATAANELRLVDPNHNTSHTISNEWGFLSPDAVQSRACLQQEKTTPVRYPNYAPT